MGAVLVHDHADTSGPCIDGQAPRLRRPSAVPPLHVACLNRRHIGSISPEAWPSQGRNVLLQRAYSATPRNSARRRRPGGRDGPAHRSRTMATANV